MTEYEYLVLLLKKELRRLKCLPVRIQYLSKYQLIKEKEYLTLMEFSAESIKLTCFNRKPLTFTNISAILTKLSQLPDELGKDSTHKAVQAIAIPPYPVKERLKQSNNFR